MNSLLQTCFPKCLAKRTTVSYKPHCASPSLPYGYVKPSLLPEILLQEKPIVCCSDEGDIAVNAGVSYIARLLAA